MGMGAKLTDDEKRTFEKRCANAMNAAAHRAVKAVGIDDSDCISQAHDRANQLTFEVKRACEQQAEGLADCTMVSKHIVQYPTPISSTIGIGQYNERDSNEESCRVNAINRAETDAVSSCENEYGISCDLISRGVVNEYRTKIRRRFVILGPKEEYQVCSASAMASPDSRYRVQCSVRVVVRAR